VTRLLPKHNQGMLPSSSHPCVGLTPTHNTAAASVNRGRNNWTIDTSQQ
jgi:hypothetical protein